MNKIIYNSRVLPRIEECIAIPYEVIGGRRGKSSQNITLNKKLVCYIGNQITLLTAVTSSNATNYYDQILNSVNSMTNKYFGVKLEYLLVLVATMQSIKMLLRTSYRVSERFYTGSQDIPFQGDVQGNGAALSIWLII